MPTDKKTRMLKNSVGWTRTNTSTVSAWKLKDPQIAINHTNYTSKYRYIYIHLVRDFKLCTQIIKYEYGLIVTDAEEIAEVWRKYCSKLYGTFTRTTKIATRTKVLKPGILRSEVEMVVNGKSPENDGITAEVVKAM